MTKTLNMNNATHYSTTMLELSRPGYTLTELLVLSLHLFRNFAHSGAKTVLCKKTPGPLPSWHPAARPDLPWQDSSCASNHTQINPSGYILGGVLHWTFFACKSTNKTTTKTPESACHRSGRRLLEEKQLKRIETMEKKPMDEQSEKNVAKI